MNDEGSDSSGRPAGADAPLSGMLRATDERAEEITELARRALSAEINLLAYVGELEDEIRRLRRQLGDAQVEAADGAG